MTQLNDTSTIHEVQCQVQENHLGELLGRVIDIETKFNMVVLQNQKLNSMLSDYENTNQKLEDLKKEYAELKSNADAFQIGMKEAREQLQKVAAERQAAQEEALALREEIAALKAPKPRRKTRKVANGKYNQNQAQ
jgi:septal ring factor EnvC (AmiA/AmiB activator)